MPSRITLVLEILDDGKWHGMEELQQQMELTSAEMREIARFLGDYGFAEIDETNQRVKINRAFKNILAQNIT